MRLVKTLSFLLLTLVVWPMPLHAQRGLTAMLPNKANQSLVLSSYTGLDLEVIDTLVGDADGRFTYAPLLPKGMYLLDCGTTEIEFLSVEQPVTMLVDNLDDGCSVRYPDSPVNTRWTAYQCLRNEYHYGNKNPLRYHQLVDSLAELSQDYASVLMKIDANPCLQASDFMTLDAIPTNVLTTKIVAFLEQSGDDFVSGVDHLLELAEGNLHSYAFVLQYLLKGFTALGLAEVTEHLSNFPRIAEGELSQEEGSWLEALVEPYQKVRVGAKAPDFEGVTIDGKPYSLHDSEANRIIVVFWSVDCEYCHDFLTRLRNNVDLENDYELVTFALADQKKEVVKEVRRLRLPGFHFYDEARWEGKAFLDYHVSSTPTAFLLDGDRTILAKPNGWEELRIEK